MREGEIWWVEAGYTDRNRRKARPVVVVKVLERDAFYYLPLTSQKINSLKEGEILLTHEDMESGTIKTSKVLVFKGCICNRKYLLKKIGKLKRASFDKVVRELIFYHTKNYVKIFHTSSPFTPGKTRINYAGRVYNEKEIQNLVDSALDFWLTAGRFDREFCAKFSQYLNVKHVLTCNSGSSANLLAVSALTSHKLREFKLNPGDEIITVAAGFPTTVAPIIQNNLVPVFVDIELGTYNINTDLLEGAISPRNKAIFLAHTLGIPFNLDRVLEIAEKYNLWVIEDNCDALGAEYTLKREYKLINGKVVSGRRFTGTFGHIGTSSFYPAHHITMGEGGAVYTDDTRLYRILLSFRDWGRDCWCEPGKDNTCGKRFSQKLGDLPEGYDHKYIYSHLGYNLKITDMQAAVGVAQLEKLAGFVETRRRNWQKLYEGLKELEEFFILPRYPENAHPSPFGFVLTIRDGAPFTRKEIVSYLEEKGIQTRMIFAGNITRQPAMVDGGYEYRVVGELKNTNKVMMDTFWVGVYPGLTDVMVDYMIEQIICFCQKF
ncbi:lipopolysaccharide biosynthesis protein RfbH [Thermodesulfatator atlanticus]|uniref:lipopolysaccharide biosynthesis protein RfbH n=1 Tax=Thermodesulfatator atlanticus TaxID=501497 RepID=UPI0003B41BE4|nr:lipopolysaccharide biosynthesis protein RfbH [Thermodesulfatator atlanticus]